MISVSKNENKQYPNVKYVQKRNLMSKCKKTTHDKSILIKSIQSELAMNRNVSTVSQLVNRHDYSRRELTLDQAKNAVSGAINSIKIDNIVKDAVNNKNL